MDLRNTRSSAPHDGSVSHPPGARPTSYARGRALPRSPRGPRELYSPTSSLRAPCRILPQPPPSLPVAPPPQSTNPTLAPPARQPPLAPLPTIDGDIRTSSHNWGNSCLHTFAGDESPVSQLESQQVIRPMRLTPDLVDHAPPSPGCITWAGTSSRMHRESVISTSTSVSSSGLATPPLSPTSPSSPLTPITPLYCDRDSITFNAPLFSTPWRYSAMLAHTHARASTPSSSSSSSTSSTHLNDEPKPVLLPIGKKTRASLPQIPTGNPVARPRGGRAHRMPSDTSPKTPEGVNQTMWRRGQLLSLDATKFIPSTPQYTSTPTSSCGGSFSQVGLGLSPHPQMALPPPTPIASASDVDLLCAILSAEMSSPIEDEDLSLREKRVLRRRGVDFHSNARFAEVFDLSETEIEPEFVADSTDAREMNSGGVDGDRDDINGVQADRTQTFTTSTPAATPPLSNVETRSNESSVGDAASDDFSWKAEDSSDEEFQFHIEDDGPDSVVEFDRDSNLGVAGFFNHSPHQPVRRNRSFKPTLPTVRDSQTVQPTEISHVSGSLKEDTAVFDQTSSLLDADSSLDDHSTLDEPQSAFSDSDSDLASDGEKFFRRSPRRHKRQGSSTSGVGTLGRKLKAFTKVSISRASLRVRSRASILNVTSATPSPSFDSPATSSIASLSSPRPHASSPPSSPDYPQTFLKGVYLTAQLDLNSDSETLVSSPRTSSSSGKRPPLGVPLPSVPPCSPPIHIFPAEADTLTPSPTRLRAGAVGQDDRRMTFVDPGESMAKLEKSIARLKTHCPEDEGGGTQPPRASKDVMPSEHQGSIRVAASISKGSTSPASSHLSVSWKPAGAENPHTPFGRKRKLSFTPLPSFDFERPRSPLHSEERRSSGHHFDIKHLRRTSSLLDFSDPRLAFRSSVASDTTEASSSSTGQPTGLASSKNAQPPSPSSAPASSQKVVPFLHRPVRNDRLMAHLPARASKPVIRVDTHNPSTPSTPISSGSEAKPSLGRKLSRVFTPPHLNSRSQSSNVHQLAQNSKSHTSWWDRNQGHRMRRSSLAVIRS